MRRSETSHTDKWIRDVTHRWFPDRRCVSWSGDWRYVAYAQMFAASPSGLQLKIESPQLSAIFGRSMNLRTTERIARITNKSTASMAATTNPRIHVVVQGTNIRNRI